MVWMPASAWRFVSFAFGTEFAYGFRLAALGSFHQYHPLNIGQLVPGGRDEDGNLGGIEPRVDAIFSFLMPAEIENPGYWPTISVDDTAFEGRIDLARRSLHDGGAERLEEVAVNRRDANFRPVRSGPAIGLFR